MKRIGVVALALIAAASGAVAVSEAASTPATATACRTSGGVLKLLQSNGTCASGQSKITLDVPGPRGPSGPPGPVNVYLMHEINATENTTISVPAGTYLVTLSMQVQASMSNASNATSWTATTACNLTQSAPATVFGPSTLETFELPAVSENGDGTFDYSGTTKPSATGYAVFTQSETVGVSCDLHYIRSSTDNAPPDSAPTDFEFYQIYLTLMPVTHLHRTGDD